jgi:gliding motility-associated lipoprotein GldH
MKLSLIIFYFVLGVVFLQLSSCNQLDTFEKNTSIPKYEWKSSFEVKGSFSITDTTSSYITYIVLRHTDAYRYNNIWLNIGIQPPADTAHYQKIDLQLGTDATGWIGSGMNDIWEIRQLLFNRGMKFKKAGIYNFVITQIMRDDPLPAVMSAGLRLEKQQN